MTKKLVPNKALQRTGPRPAAERQGVRRPAHREKRAVNSRSKSKGSTFWAVKTARGLLIAGLFACGACHTRPPHGSLAEPMHCADTHVNPAVCDALASATFNPAPQGEVRSYCDAYGIGPTARVEWRTVDGDFLYKGIARFEKSSDGNSYALTDLKPLVSGWPCREEDCHLMHALPKGLTLTTPTVPVCADDKGGEGRTLTVVLPGPDVCVVPELPLPQAWCTRKDISEDYWWFEWRHRGGPRSGSFLRPSDDPEYQKDFQRLSESFWAAPAPEDKSCRDGNSWTIAGRKNEQWRVMRGRCQPLPFGLDEVAEPQRE